MKRLIIFIIMMIMASSMAFATITRSGSGDTVTYTSSLSGSYDKAFWAVAESVNGCSVTGVACSGTNVNCALANNIIRVVAYTPDGGGNIQQSVTVTVSGSDACSLTNGLGVESYAGNPGSQASLSGSATLDMGTRCTEAADSNQDCAVSNSELLSYISSWISSTVTNSNLLNAISIWINGGY